MGRRKIEIRAIKDDRNRSVTFLKRKGGLFKKAHELSVLCSVDVAVIIFGHNKKLYEFSSGDINETLGRYSYYGPPHEHKGPSDFKNKGGDDDDDEEDDGDDGSQKREESVPPPPQQQQPSQHLMPPHLQHHNSFQHVRQPAASASPPMPNGMFQQRHPTPQPPNALSRSNSRNEIRRPTSSLMPMQQPQPVPPPQNGFAYHPNPSIYNPHAAVQAAVPPHASPQPQFQHFQPQQQQQQTQQQQQQMHMAHQQFLQEQRRQSQPPPPVTNSLQPPPQPAPRSSPQPDQHSLRPPSPPDRKHSTSKSQSIFTPIDEGGSMLARVFFGGDPPPKREERRQSPPEIRPPPRSISQPSSQLSRGPVPTQPPRATTTTSAPTDFGPPQRSDTNGSKSGSSRPKLNLQIPSESEENESGSGSPRGASDNRSANPDRGQHNGIVLPPPSPSASALLSAGVSGPPNPFARPPPPTSQNNNAYTENRNGNNNMDTPVSALPPSRYMEQSLIASPGGLFSDWDNWGRSGIGSAVLPSPLTFPTPSGERPPNFFGKSESNVNEEKRKAEEVAAGDTKRLKT